MIAALDGVVRAYSGLGKPGAFRFVIDTGNGVGYVIATSSLTAQMLKHGERASLLVYTKVAENTLDLYAFASVEERRLFEHLLGVKDVGPSTALALLSGAGDVAVTVDMIAKADAKRLTSIKGIGPETANKIIAKLAESFAAVGV